MISSTTHPYLHEISRATSHVCCYSDGCKRGYRIGFECSVIATCSHICLQISSPSLRHYKLPPLPTVNIKFVVNAYSTIYLILSDSLSSIITISKRYSTQVFIHRLQVTCHTALQSPKKKILLGIWIRSCIGWAGNEAIDITE